jgi:hypothetical protein
MTIRNRKISNVRLDKNNVDAPTINRALDNIINNINPYINDSVEAINNLQEQVDNVEAAAGIVIIQPENASSISGQTLIFSGSGGISFGSNATNTLTITQQPLSVGASNTAGFGSGNTLIVSGTGGATITRSGTTLTINPNIPIATLTAGSNIVITPAGTNQTIALADPISLSTITGSQITSSNFIGWGNNIVRPYIAACDLTTQTASATTDANPMRFTTTEEALGVSIVSGSRITFAYDGVYNIQFSAQIDKSSGGASEIDIWFAETGSNIPRSNTAFFVQGSNARSVAALNFVRTFTSGSYAEIYWQTDNTDVRLLYATSASSPDRPEIPSAILTVTQV